MPLPAALTPSHYKPAPEVAWLYLSPGGGERFGDLVVVALELVDGLDMVDAVASLIKRAFCLEEEFDYQPWTEEVASSLHVWLSHICLEWVQQPVSKTPHVDWLEELGHGVVKAQRTLVEPCNPWQASTEAWDGVPLAELGFLRADTLVVRVATKWNDTALVFKQGRFVYYAGWSTSA